MREIIGYQLIVEDDILCFNETVNCHLDDGYQIMEGIRATVDESRDGDMIYRIEMVRYAPERTVFAGEPMQDNRVIPRLRTEPVEEDDEVMAVPMPDPPRNMWTADSPDPFDGDDEQDDEEMNDHQLNRLGALRGEVEERATIHNAVIPQFDETAAEGVGHRVPESLTRAVRDMREAGILRNTSPFEEGDNEAPF